MNVSEAWLTLGRDPSKVLESIASAGPKESRVAEAEKELEKARVLAKKLLALHHPDKNSSDPEASERFARVQTALSVIERETLGLRERAQSMGQRASGRDVFIEIKKT